MKKTVSVVSVVVLVVAACVAGMKTDKIVFNDATELTTASGGGAPPATNTTTVVFDQGVTVNGDGTGYSTYIGLDEGTDYALRTTDGMYEAKLLGNGRAAEFLWSGNEVSVLDGTYALYVMGSASSYFDDGTTSLTLTDGDTALRATKDVYTATLASGTEGSAGYFSDNNTYAEFADGTYAGQFNGPNSRTVYLADSGIAGVFADGTRSVYLADGMDCLQANYGGYLAYLSGDSYSAAGYFSDGTRSAWLADGMYAGQFNGPNSRTAYFADSSAAGYLSDGSRSVYISDGSDSLQASYNGLVVYLAGDTYGAAGYFSDGTRYARFGDGMYAGEFYDGVQTAYLADGTYAVNASSGDIHAADDVVLDMDDASGMGTSWHEWAIGGTQDSDDNWRMGVVDSNLVVQVRVSGAWVNATVFSRP